MTDELNKKIEQSIKLLQSVCRDGKVAEVCYSGGKDSDVILQLAKESGINYRAIYKNTTIDPPGTIKHVRDMGVEIRRPDKSFFQLMEKNGFPTRFYRFCCRFLKEYKILDRAIMGVRKSEGVRRAKSYSEPTECRFYGSKKEHVEAIYPILDWTDDDVEAFLKDRHIQCAPVYYSGGGIRRKAKIRLYVLSVEILQETTCGLPAASGHGESLHKSWTGVLEHARRRTTQADIQGCVRVVRGVQLLRPREGLLEEQERFAV